VEAKTDLLRQIEKFDLNRLKTAQPQLPPLAEVREDVQSVLLKALNGALISRRRGISLGQDSEDAVGDAADDSDWD
jgi:hypothetical protein